MCFIPSDGNGTLCPSRYGRCRTQFRFSHNFDFPSFSFNSITLQSISIDLYKSGKLLEFSFRVALVLNVLHYHIVPIELILGACQHGIAHLERTASGR